MSSTETSFSLFPKWFISPRKPPQPINPRRWLENAQARCLFLTKLPAEIRNEIYMLVFGADANDYLHDDWPRSLEEIEEQENRSKDPLPTPTSTDTRVSICSSHVSPKSLVFAPKKKEEDSKPHHPLSFLATCRKINREAREMAFGVHHFKLTLKAEDGAFARAKTDFLGEKLYGVRRLFYDGQAAIWWDSRASHFTWKAISIFPNVEVLQIGYKRDFDDPRSMHEKGRSERLMDVPREKRDEQHMLNDYPRCWVDFMHAILGRRKHTRQECDFWKIDGGVGGVGSGDLGEFDMSKHYTMGDWREVIDRLESVLRTYPGGETKCACGCGMTKIVRTRLVQGTGRKLMIEMVHYDEDEEFRMKFKKGERIKLRPGVDKLPLVEVHHGTGLYWKGLSN